MKLFTQKTSTALAIGLLAQVASPGAMAQEISYESVAPKPNANAGADRLLAVDLYTRLAGVRPALDAPVIDDMVDAIQLQGMKAAARIATDEAGFYNHVVRDFAARMSTREETSRSDLSDFVATIIGVVRDGEDARKLLTGDFYYMGDPGVVSGTVPSDVLADVVTSNGHYDELDDQRFDLAQVLIKVQGQQLRGPGDTLEDHPDPAGVITSRAFMEAHATAGTNRRLAQFMFREFACMPMDNWADASMPDNYVRRDVERAPGGEPGVYQTECKACHAPLDALGGAFAAVDFDDGYTKYADFYPDGNGGDEQDQNPLGVSSKMNHNDSNFPGGYFTAGDAWENYALGATNQATIGWRGDVLAGRGMRELGRALSRSQSFSSCMATRVFLEVCRRPPAPEELDGIASWAGRFESTDYNLRDLFETIAVQEECIGEQ